MDKNILHIVDMIDQHKVRIPLSVEHIVLHYSNGRRDAEIARIHGVSKQAVSQFKERHMKELDELIQKDNFLALKFKSKTFQALDALSQKKLSDASAAQLSVVAGVCVDKMRLLQEKSTANIAYADITADTQRLKADMQRLEKEIEEMVAQHPELQENVNMMTKGT